MKKVLFGVLLSLCFSCTNSHGGLPFGAAKPIPGLKEFDIPGPKGIKIHIYQTRPANVKREIIWVHGMPGIPAGDHFAPPNFFLDAAVEDSIITYYDRPGFGGTTSPAGGTNLLFELEVIGTLLTQNRGVSHYVAGWSAGGRPTLGATLAYPTLVNGAFIACGAVKPLPDPIAKALPQLRVPIVLTHGDSDPIVPYNHMTYLVGEIEKAGVKPMLVEARTLKGVDHGIVRNHPKVVKELLEKMINKAEHP